ncbi:hypothetical protein [Mycobacteroides abscessus]|uniref:hypothetical protein n=1 Tax=Mycobacteroides abscessus TaxID=36809 RepID=UPI00104581EB|nr:hypothetical protein [Mycobacteroides abscessus]
MRKRIEFYLSDRLQRRVTVKEVADAMSYDRNHYAKLRDTDSIPVERVQEALRNLGLNETAVMVALVELGYQDREAMRSATSYLDNEQPASATVIRLPHWGTEVPLPDNLENLAASQPDDSDDTA